MSYVAFDNLINDMKEKNKELSFADVMPVITKNFGLIEPASDLAKKEANAALVMTEYEYSKLLNAFAESMKAVKTDTQETYLLYGGYNPLSVSLTHILNNKAGIGWTSYSHTGTPVPVFAMGAGSELFNGAYDNTDVFQKLVKATGLKK
jgi:alkaline phosphatase